MRHRLSPSSCFSTVLPLPRQAGSSCRGDVHRGKRKCKQVVHGRSGGSRLRLVQRVGLLQAVEGVDILCRPVAANSSTYLWNKEKEE